MHCYLHLVLPSLAVLDVGILILVHQQVRCRSQSPWDLELIGTCMGLGLGGFGTKGFPDLSAKNKSLLQILPVSLSHLQRAYNLEDLPKILKRY